LKEVEDEEKTTHLGKILGPRGLHLVGTISDQAFLGFFLRKADFKIRDKGLLEVGKGHGVKTVAMD